MQIIVFGMHRSGTSPLARLINMMGAYTGHEGSLIEPRSPNPKGYWERKDVQLLNDEILQSVGATWSRTMGFEPEKLSADTLTMFEQQATRIVYNLDAHRPWVLKDPRLCLTFPVWRKVLEVPVCVHIHRNPLEVAQSLKTRGDLPVSTSIALWEKYNLAALAYTQGLPRLSVSHRKLMEQPVVVVKTLYEELTALGVQGLRCPSEREVRAFVDAGLYRERMGPQREQEFVNAVQLKLFTALEDGSAQNWETVPALSGGALEILARHEEEEKNAQIRQSVREALQAKQTEAEEWQQKVAAVEAAQQAEIAAWQQKIAAVEAAQQAEAEEWQQKVAAVEAAKQAEREAWQQKVAAVEAAKQSEIAVVEAAQQAEAEEWQQKITAVEVAKQAEAEEWQQKVAAVEAAKQAEAEEWQQKVAAAEAAQQAEAEEWQQKVAAVEAAKQAEREAWQQKVAAVEAAKQSEIAVVEAAQQAEAEEWQQKVAAVEAAQQAESEAWQQKVAAVEAAQQAEAEEWQQKVAAAEAAQQAEAEEWQQKVAAATRRAAEQEAKLSVMQAARHEERQRLDAALAQLQSQLQEAGKRLAEGEAKRTVGQAAHHEEQQRYDATVAQVQDQLKNSLSTTAQKEAQIAGLTKQLQQRSEDVKRLVSWLEKLDTSTSALLQSKRWRIGNTIGEILRRVQFKHQVPMAPDAFRTILKQFHTWKRDNDQL